MGIPQGLLQGSTPPTSEPGQVISRDLKMAVACSFRLLGCVLHRYHQVVGLRT